MLSMKINCFHGMITLSEGCPWKWANLCRPSLWYSYERVMYDNKLPDIAQTYGICVRKSPMKIHHHTSALSVSVDTMQLLTFVEVNIRIYLSKADAEVNIIHHETIYPFSFEFKGSSLSDTRCMIQDVVIKNGATLYEIFSAELFCHDVISLECGGKRQCKQRKQSKRMNRKNNVTLCTKCSLHQSMVQIY